MKTSSQDLRWIIIADQVIVWLSKHWLAVINTVFALYLGLALLTPVLMATGHPYAAHILYAAYGVNCHQLADRSFFLFGEKAVYSLQELLDRGYIPDDELSTRRAFVGNAEAGYKIAFCERDTAIYASILAAGLLFAALRRRLRPLPFIYVVIVNLPMFFDGTTQFFGWRESTWWLRVVTGTLTGFGTVLWALPHFEMAAMDTYQQATTQLARARERLRESVSGGPGDPSQ